MRSRISCAIIVFFVLDSGHSYAQTGSGDERFIKASSIIIERCSVDSTTVSTKSFDHIDLSKSDLAQIRRMIIKALRRNRAAEIEAKRQGKVTAGVWAFVNYRYRLSFVAAEQHEYAWLHARSDNVAWLSGEKRVGTIVFTKSEVAKILALLEKTPVSN